VTSKKCVHETAQVLVTTKGCSCDGRSLAGKLREDEEALELLPNAEAHEAKGTLCHERGPRLRERWTGTGPTELGHP